MVLLIVVGVSLCELPNRFRTCTNFSLGDLVRRRLCYREHLQQPLRRLGWHHIGSTHYRPSMALLQPTPCIVVAITYNGRRQHRG